MLLVLLQYLVLNQNCLCLMQFLVNQFSGTMVNFKFFPLSLLLKCLCMVNNLYGSEKFFTSKFDMGLVSKFCYKGRIWGCSNRIARLRKYVIGIIKFGVSSSLKCTHFTECFQITKFSTYIKLKNDSLIINNYQSYLLGPELRLLTYHSIISIFFLSSP